METASLTPADIAGRLRAIGISPPYASQIANGKRPPSDDMAIRIWREAGLKLGFIQDATDDEIEVIARVLDRRAS